jgi:hypothetical protein
VTAPCSESGSRCPPNLADVVERKHVPDAELRYTDARRLPEHLMGEKLDPIITGDVIEHFAESGPAPRSHPDALAVDGSALITTANALL